MNNDEPWYLGQRAEQLAIVYLTRNNNLSYSIISTPELGFDIVVKIMDQDPDRVFGVEVKAVVKKSRRIKVKFTKNEVFQMQKVKHPVALFVFIMENDTGFFTWLVEPKVLPDETIQLQPVITKSLQDLSSTSKPYVTYAIPTPIPLNDNTLDLIISQVNAWYDKKPT